MGKVKVRHIGKRDFQISHGDVTEIFAPGEEREIPFYLAESLLREESVERKWKKNGQLAGEQRVKLFEAVVSQAAAETTGETDTADGNEENSGE